MTRPLTIGVIGGMGPAATFDFCARLTALAPAARDQDHPRVLVDCDPAIPDRNLALRADGPSPGPILACKARDLALAGADLLCMPCNTAHAYAADIRAAVSVPFIDMVTASVRAAARSGAGCIGVLAADGARAAELYQQAIPAAGLEIRLLGESDQERFMTAVYAVKAGDLGPGVRSVARDLARILIDAGAGALIAGCTEVPLILGVDDLDKPLISSTDELARAVLARAYTPG